jgi:hypothetical protein
MFSGMAGIPIKLIDRIKKINPATGERPLIIGKAISPSATHIVADLEKNSKTRNGGHGSAFLHLKPAMAIRTVL